MILTFWRISYKSRTDLYIFFPTDSPYAPVRAVRTESLVLFDHDAFTQFSLNSVRLLFKRDHMSCIGFQSRQLSLSPMLFFMTMISILFIPSEDGILLEDQKFICVIFFAIRKYSFLKFLLRLSSIPKVLASHSSFVQIYSDLSQPWIWGLHGKERFCGQMSARSIFSS